MIQNKEGDINKIKKKGHRRTNTGTTLGSNLDLDNEFGTVPINSIAKGLFQGMISLC